MPQRTYPEYHVIMVNRLGYNHAGFVSNDGVWHFDPREETTSEAITPREIQQAVTGMPGHPHLLQGARILEVFPPEDTTVLPLPSNLNVDDIEARITQVRRHIVLGLPRTYLLFSNNCQHFATWLQTGVAKSMDVSRLQHAAKEGVCAGVRAFTQTQEALRPACDTKLFSETHLMGRVGNFIAFIIILLLVLITSLVVGAAAFTSTTAISYLDAWTQPLQEHKTPNTPNNSTQIKLPLRAAFIA